MSQIFGMYKYHVSYLIGDLFLTFSHIQFHDWKYLIVDEGHRIKNFQCKLIRYAFWFLYPNMLSKSERSLLATRTDFSDSLS